MHADGGDAEDVRKDRDELSFELTFRGAVAASAEDQRFPFTLELRSEVGVIRTVDVVVLVPGSGE